jgi:hypothetical protein
LTFLRKHTPPNVAIPHFLVYSRTILADLWAQKVYSKNFTILPIIKYAIIKYGQSTNFGKKFRFLHHWPYIGHPHNISAVGDDLETVTPFETP